MIRSQESNRIAASAAEGVLARHIVANTAVIDKFGLNPKTMPTKPMSVEQRVSEGLSGLIKNRSRVVPGRLNRIMNALVPASLERKLLADCLVKGLSARPHLQTHGRTPDKRFKGENSAGPAKLRSNVSTKPVSG